MYVLQPFENCNRRTAACAVVNAFHNNHVTLKKGLGFWDLKSKIDSLEGSDELGSFDSKSHQIQVCISCPGLRHQSEALNIIFLPPPRPHHHNI